MALLSFSWPPEMKSWPHKGPNPHFENICFMQWNPVNCLHTNWWQLSRVSHRSSFLELPKNARDQDYNPIRTFVGICPRFKGIYFWEAMHRIWGWSCEPWHCKHMLFHWAIVHLQSPILSNANTNPKVRMPTCLQTTIMDVFENPACSGDKERRPFPLTGLLWPHPHPLRLTMDIPMRSQQHWGNAGVKFWAGKRWTFPLILAGHLFQSIVP